MTPEHDLGAVLRIPAFRRLWVALSLSSLGDWLGLLATTALAATLSGGDYAKANFAIAGVLIARLLPAVFLGPLAGVVADRLDRRWTMVVCDVLRFALFTSIPLIGTLWWLFTASFLIECVSLFWIPAKEATVPNLVPRRRLEAANQLSLLTTYGSAPVAAGLFAGLALLTGVLAAGIPFFGANPLDLALCFNAATFLVSAATIYRLTEIPPRERDAGLQPGQPKQTVVRTLLEGWRFVGRTPLVRGLVVGMLGAFAAGGALVGLARTYVADLGAGDPGYGLLFGTVFVGLAGGMFLGPRLFAGASRRRLFALSIVGAGCALALLALISNMVIAVLVTALLGAFTGVAWVTGYTLLGLEVADELRGRTFAFVQSMARVTLVLVLALAPVLAGTIGRHTFRITEDVALSYNGAAITLFIAGLAAAAVGVAALRQMDDRPDVPLWRELVAGARGPRGHGAEDRAAGAFFVAFEGGEGAGKSTQTELLAAWLRGRGHEVVVTREPGATPAGQRLRAVLLDPSMQALSPRAEALLYAADRADHVAAVIAPALARGAVVVTDRYVDSSLAYQGAGRALPLDEVRRLSRWATGGLRPDITVLLDVPADVGLRRSAGPTDRLESEPLDFHDRVRAGFRDLAVREPERYVVIDATQPPAVVAQRVRERLVELLPESPAELEALAAEERAAEERARLAAEEEQRRQEEERQQRELVQEQERQRRAEERQRLEEERRTRAEQQAQERAERQRQRAADRRRRAQARREARAETRQRRLEERRRRAELRASAAAERKAAKEREEARRAAEHQQAEEERRRAEEQRRLEEAERRRAEERRKLEEQRLAQERLVAEAARRAEEQRLAAERLREEAARRGEEQRQAASRVRAEAARRAEQQRLAAEQQRLAAEQPPGTVTRPTLAETSAGAPERAPGQAPAQGDDSATFELSLADEIFGFPAADHERDPDAEDTRPLRRRDS